MRRLLMILGGVVVLVVYGVVASPVLPPPQPTTTRFVVSPQASMSPVSTVTPIGTATPVGIGTLIPTTTRLPQSPLPTSTIVPTVPTVFPAPTDTPLPPTATSVPPTPTPVPPTATPIPPTPTPIPPTPTPTSTPVPGLSTEEFVGPFASWENVKTTDGAVGNCIADDTASFQAMLDHLGMTGQPVVGWIPAGCYKITATLRMATRIHISLIGEDPTTTTLRWAGASNGILLQLNGVAYSKVDRLTFDGQSSAGELVDQSYDSSLTGTDGVGNGTTTFTSASAHWGPSTVGLSLHVSGGGANLITAVNSPTSITVTTAVSTGTSLSYSIPHGYFDTGNEYADDVFQDSYRGIGCGLAGGGCSEMSVLRAHFLRNSGSGMILGNFNALDIWVWDSLFQDNAIGMTNDPGAGNFHVYDSVFLRSTVADIEINNAGFFNIRGNTSIGSAKFIVSGGGFWTVEGNTILDPTTSPLMTFRIAGPLLMVDNVIRTQSGVTAPFVTSGVGANLLEGLLINNTFTAATPFSLTGNVRVHEIGTTIVSAASLAGLGAPTLPGVLPNNHRTIFDVAAGSNTATIQAAITNAVAAGNHAVVHINGTNILASMGLTVPANAAIQIIGDGGTTQIVAGSSAATPLLTLVGPNTATLRDFDFQGANVSDGILVTNADQVGARVDLQEANLTSQRNLWVDQLDHTLVQLTNSNHSQSNSTHASVQIDGGTSAAAGNWLGGQTNLLNGGSGSSAGLAYDVTHGAHAVVRDIWYEGGSSTTQIHLSGPSTVTFAGLRLSSPVGGTPPSVDLADHQGLATFLDNDIDDRVIMSGNGTGSTVFGYGFFFNTLGLTGYWQNNTTPATNALLINSVQFDPSNTVRLPEVGTYSDAFVLAAMAQARAVQPVVTSALGAGVTDVRMYRVYVDQATTGIHVTP